MVFKRLFGRVEAPDYSLSPGKRVYAIGDVHGRLDLLNALLIKIDADRAKAPTLDHHIVFLGDYLDRGPESAGVIDRLMGLADSDENPTILMGNHEDFLLQSLDGDRDMLKAWVTNGGKETILSYGIDRRSYEQLDYDELMAQLPDLIPEAHVQFIRGMKINAKMDGYLFVHAGIRPEVPLNQQKREEMLWIRGRFINSDADHGAIVVHGHCITDEVEILPNRIGVDTGAYASDRLSAIVLEGRERRVLDASF